MTTLRELTEAERMMIVIEKEKVTTLRQLAVREKHFRQ